MKTISVALSNVGGQRHSQTFEKLEVVRDEFILDSRNQDAAALKGQGARGLLEPKTWQQLANWLAHNPQTAVLPQGALSSLTGGATPNGDILISSKHFRALDINVAKQTVRVGAGVFLSDLQEKLQDHGLFYPPAPTYDGSTIGGNLSTNAAGAATYRYGTTRDWVEELSIVLPTGDHLQIRRGEYAVGPGDRVVLDRGDDTGIEFIIPSYQLPDVKKISCGLYIRDEMDLIDLFIGHEATLGFITEAVLRVIPEKAISTVLCCLASQGDCRALVSALRALASKSSLAVRSMEYFDSRCLTFLKRHGRLDVYLPSLDAVDNLVLFELESDGELEGDVIEESFLSSLEDGEGLFS